MQAQTERKTTTKPEPRFVIALSDLNGGAIRIPLAITGTWAREGSKFSITKDDLEGIARNFAARKNGEINVDYDHASEMPEVAAGGPVPSAGRIVRLDGPEDIDSLNHWSIDPLKKARSSNGSMNPSSNGSILWGWYEPTDRARNLIANGEYRYISPAIDWGARSKQTGKPQGTTLTSVALTNRPFLEELPQIRLADPSYRLVDVGEVHVDTSLGQDRETRSQESGARSQESGARSQESGARSQESGARSQESGARSQKAEGEDTPGSIQNPRSKIQNPAGGFMKHVKLSVEDGKVRVGHDDFSDAYYADPEEMKQCLDDLGFGPQPADPESGIRNSDSLAEEIRELAGMPGRAEGSAADQPASATLSECVAALRRRLNGRAEISLTEAGALLSESEAGGKYIAAADYFRSRVEQELEAAVKGGKVLPRQRDDWRKIALSDFPTFRKILAEQKPQVPLRPVGVSGAGPEDAPTQVKLLAEQRMRDRRITFGQALSEIGREQPELVHEYRRAVSAE